MGIEYKGLSEKYNNYHSQPDEYFELQLEKIKKYLNFSRSKKYLDVGCGAGRLLIPLVREAYEIKGIDSSKEMINSCIKNTCMQLDLSISEFNNFKFNKKFDGIYFSMSLHQMHNQEGMIKKALRMLKKNGKLLIITVSHKQFDEILLNKYFSDLDMIDRNRFLTVNELSRIIKKNNGFIECIEEQTIYQKIPKERYIEMIENKYISSLQLINEYELRRGIRKIKENYKGKKFIIVPDCYTYIVVKKK